VSSAATILVRASPCRRFAVPGRPALDGGQERAGHRSRRNRQFFSLVELNAAIQELVTRINDRVTRHLGTSRRALFDAEPGARGAQWCDGDQRSCRTRVRTLRCHGGGVPPWC